MSANSSPPGKDNGNDVAGRGRLPAPASRRFTPAELAAFDGSDPAKPILIAYRGIVYDVSGRFLWVTGRHFWLHAGRDITGRMSEGPHGEEMLQDAPRVGVLVTDGK
jgi:predicted heme/steroid binding protein